jgi:hypothetical protein
MPAIDQHRKAAVSVYFLNEKDRQWLLSQLATEEKERLNRLLDELAMLSLPRDQITRKTLLSYMDIPLDDDLYGLLTEILEKDASVLVGFINDEPAWLGKYLMHEYPSLFDAMFRAKLSRHKLNHIGQFPESKVEALTDRTRHAVFRSVQKQLMKKYLDKGSSERPFSDFMDQHVIDNQETA